MGKCELCGRTGNEIASALGVCLHCIREKPEEAMRAAKRVHERSREMFGLRPYPPRGKWGMACGLCVNQCVMDEGEEGYCGIRKNAGGRLYPDFDSADLSFYYDPLPTNCVADWVCPGGTGRGYPKYAHRRGPEYGYKNLAIFFHSCSFDCLFCQNWHFKERKVKGSLFKPSELEGLVDDRTSCICFFGRDPSCQMPFAISFSKLARKKKKSDVLRICFETNGSMKEEFADQAFELCLESGGCMKFDLKAWDEPLHTILTGVTKDRTVKNFSRLAKRIGSRPDPPPLVASTLMIPGYIDEREVEGIAKFIGELDPYIPYTLLAFYPHYYMKDLPLTRKAVALRLKEVAEQQGLRNVSIGNVHLLI